MAPAPGVRDRDPALPRAPHRGHLPDVLRAGALQRTPRPLPRLVGTDHDRVPPLRRPLPRAERGTDHHPGLLAQALASRAYVDLDRGRDLPPHLPVGSVHVPPAALPVMNGNLNRAFVNRRGRVPRGNFELYSWFFMR